MIHTRYPIIIFVAWLSFITSMFLPTATVMSESVVGWAAALFSIQAIFGFYKSLFLAYISLLGLCNFLMLLSPVIVLYTFKKKGYLVYRLLMSVAAIDRGKRIRFGAAVKQTSFNFHSLVARFGCTNLSDASRSPARVGRNGRGRFGPIRRPRFVRPVAHADAGSSTLERQLFTGPRAPSQKPDFLEKAGFFHS